MGRRIQAEVRVNLAGGTVVAGLCLSVALFLWPMGWSLPPLAVSPQQQTEVVAPLLPPVQTEDSQIEATSLKDAETTVRLVRADGTVEQLTMADYLWGVVAAEMPASFHLEALKAQAVAARTYTIKRQEASVHENGDVCDDSTCCQAYIDRADAMERWGDSGQMYADKITQAVAETDGLAIYYEGEPIEALFFAAAAGRTVDAVEVWGNAVDYLVGVNSPEGAEVPNYYSQVTLTKAEVAQKIATQYPNVELGDDCSGWFYDATYTSSGSVQTIHVGNLTLTGNEVRTLFGLRSATFALHWEGENLVFDVTGYGHGVGMSQYGANALAGEGKTFHEILAWYYTGTSVE